LLDQLYGEILEPDHRDRVALPAHRDQAIGRE
jgi:hypothetical protein